MSTSASDPPASSASNRARRTRFAIALIVFVAWVAGLTFMAIRAEPPRRADAPGLPETEPR